MYQLIFLFYDRNLTAGPALPNEASTEQLWKCKYVYLGGQWNMVCGAIIWYFR